MHNLLFALSLFLCPLRSFAELAPLLSTPTLTTTVYAILSPSTVTVSETVTSTPTFQQACFLLFPTSPISPFTSFSSLKLSSLVVQQNNNYSATSSSFVPQNGHLSSTTSTPNSYGGDILVASSTIPKIKTISNKTITATTTPSPKIRVAGSNTTKSSVTDSNILSIIPVSASTATGSSAGTSNTSSSSKILAPSTKTTTGGTRTATAGAAREKGDVKSTAQMVWVAVALGALGVGMISWG